MIAGGRSPNAAAQRRVRRPRRRGARRAARPGRRVGPRPSGSGGSPACRSRARARGCGAGSRAGRDRAEDAVVVEAGLADGHDPVVARPGGDRAQPASSTLAASCGWTPTAASSHGNRSTRASARSDDATFQPGTRIRSTPASRAPPMTRSASPSKRSALRWQWLSTRRTRQVGRRLGVEPREERLRRRRRGPASARWAPQASSSRIGGPPLPSAPYG